MEKHFPRLLILLSISLSFIAGGFSVKGLSELFGGSLAVLILACILEITKVILTSGLKLYWSSISLSIKSYSCLAVLILMAITSLGIYGKLSNSYQENYNSFTIQSSKIELAKSKLNRFTEIQESKQSEKDQLTKSNSELLSALSNNVVQYKDTKTGNIISSTSSSNRKAYEDQLRIVNAKTVVVDSIIDNLNDSIFLYNTEILEMESELKSSNEIGSLIFLQKLSGVPMDQIVNYMIFMIMIVFDPLAIVLLLFAINIFNKKIELLQERSTIKTAEENTSEEVLHDEDHDITEKVEKEYDILADNYELSEEEEKDEEEGFNPVVIEYKGEEKQNTPEENSEPIIKMEEYFKPNDTEEKKLSEDQLNDLHHKFYYGKKKSPADMKNMSEWQFKNSK